MPNDAFISLMGIGGWELNSQTKKIASLLSKNNYSCAYLLLLFGGRQAAVELQYA